MHRFFRVTPPTVHQMVLASKGWADLTQAGVPRSIAVLLERSALPELNPRVRSTGQNHCAEVLGREAIFHTRAELAVNSAASHGRIPQIVLCLRSKLGICDWRTVSPTTLTAITQGVLT